MKKLVAYFSASRITAQAAQILAKQLDSDLFEIVPAVPYTDDDLNWMDKNSRSSKEMSDPSSRPAIKNTVNDMSLYDTIFLGFPIWWYVAPTIINTFLESYDFSGKKIILFATSGGSGFGKTASILKKCCAAEITEGKLINCACKDIPAWVRSMK